jgi:hypothetical protein
MSVLLDPVYFACIAVSGKPVGSTPPTCSMLWLQEQIASFDYTQQIQAILRDWSGLCAHASRPWVKVTCRVLARSLHVKQGA